MVHYGSNGELQILQLHQLTNIICQKFEDHKGIAKRPKDLKSGFPPEFSRFSSTVVLSIDLLSLLRLFMTLFPPVALVVAFTLTGL